MGKCSTGGSRGQVTVLSFSLPRFGSSLKIVITKNNSSVVMVIVVYVIRLEAARQHQYIRMCCMYQSLVGGLNILHNIKTEIYN